VAKVLRSLALTQEHFENRVEDHLGAALIEFYKARAAQKNAETTESRRWARHWKREAQSLIERTLVSDLLHDTRGRWDRWRTLDGVIDSLKAKDEGYRRGAEYLVKRDFGLETLGRAVDERDSKQFWDKVARAIEGTRV
jgi:hypothetical protein